MTTNISVKKFARNLTGILIACLVMANANSATTALGTEPFTSTGSIKALPNVMFVLDDSGSMQADFLPDWAGPYQQTISSVLTTVTPPHRFFNGVYNGVAYNPATRYRPPAMYTNTGALDTTTYPSQTGESVAKGGDGTATTLARNWRAVKVDGYGIQSTSTANLEGNAFSYTTLPGEHCTTAQLRTCTASATPTGIYTFPASLRWCTTSAFSVDITANANGVCQASNIADTPTNTTNGVTNYTFPRMPRPRTALITLSGGGTVSGITVDALQIMSAGASGATDSDLAVAIVTQVNACTLSKPTGSLCTVVGYSAVNFSNFVVLTAPGATTSSPVVIGGSASAGAFSGSGVPGETLLSVITPTVTSYTYPGSATKGSNRSDCAGTTCTYDEEMTNYANWYAYHRTRMQMMKTASSIAFSSVDDKFRVGFYSINNGLNGAGTYFINPSAFNGVQKNLWYSKFFSAVPYGATPLRTGLANTGRLYAGQLSTLNSVAVTDPMQYSCQQNFTILSTDGYWNDTNNPTQIDGTTPIGQQDGALDRPYYDGGTYTRTVTQTTKTEEQLGINTFVAESRTQQLQTSARRLLETVVTTDTYPWTTKTTTLQKNETSLDQTTTPLESRTYPLTSITKELQESVFKLESTTRPLERYTYNLLETTIPLRQSITNITATTYRLQVGTQTINEKKYKLQTGTETINAATTPLQTGTETIKATTSPLQKMTQLINSTTSPLQSSTFKLQSSTRQLQKRMETSVDGGDTWQDTGWVNVTGMGNQCVTGASSPNTIRNTQCRYDTAVIAGGLNSCTMVAASLGPTFSVQQAVTCAYELVPTVLAVGSCNVVAQSGTSPYLPSVSCGYGTAAPASTGLSSCTARDQSSQASMSGDKVVCAYDAASWSNVGSCTPATPANFSGAKVSCRYDTAASTSSTVGACTGLNQATTGPMSGDQVICSYNTKTWANSGTCTPNSPANYSGNRITCQYDTSAITNSTVSSCTANSQATSGPMSGDKVACTYNSVSWSDSGTCTPNSPANYSGNRITCRYNSNTYSNGTVASCAANEQPTSAAMAGDRVVCAYNSVNWVNSTTGTCTPDTPLNFSGNQISCRYRSTASSTSSGQTTCTPNDQPTNAAMSGNRVVCAYDATPTSVSSVASCIWDTPAPATSPRTTCAYDAGLATTSPGLPTCTAVAQSTGTTNGTVWSGPAKTCTYEAAVVATNLLTCAPTGSVSPGPVYTNYSTCGYGAGVLLTNLNSCVVDPPEAGPSYNNGATVACAYSSTYATRTNVSACNPVAQSGTYSAPQTTCTYEAVGTAATNLNSCTNVAQSVGAPYAGPAVSCAYDTTPVTNLNASTCTIHDSGGSPYSGGAKVSCAYGTTTSVLNGVGSCATVAKSVATTEGTVYSPGVSCAYGASTGWTAAAAACVTVAPSGSSPYAGPARQCQYTSSVDTPTATCTIVAQDNINLTAIDCAPGASPVTISTVSNVVDACSTDPTSSGIRSTATTCAYQPAAVSDTPTCTPVSESLSSPYVTAKTCPPPTDTGFVAINPNPPNQPCTPSGTPLPAVFDGAGKIVECRTTDILGTSTAPNPTASCTSGFDTGTNVQTNCQILLSTGPTPVDPTTCATVNPPVAPSFVKTICTPTSTSATTMGCSAPAATAPLWQTVSCSPVANTGTSDTLADVAAYYYYTDLRTTALNNCVGAVVPPATVGSTLCPATVPANATAVQLMNNVTTSSSDPANWQHMTTFTLGLGASGYMKYSSSYPTDTSGDFTTVKGVNPFAPSDGIAADPANGVCSWQATGNCNWPYPASNEQTTIDDLWHAGVNGHGAYFSATNPETLASSISGALSGVLAAGGAAAAPSLSTPSLTPADSYLFSSTFTTSDWTGELVRKQLNPFSGAVSPSNDWAVQGKLDAKAVTARNIYTFDSSVPTTKLKAFTSANFATDTYFNSPHISTSPSGLTQFVCASADVCLSATDQNTTHAAGANLVNFLRGERTNEGAEIDNTKYYRQRQHVLGDLVNAQAVYVNKPLYNYSDAGYSSFVTAQSSRQAAVYAGSNDGMLHAFAAKGTVATEALVDAAAAAAAASSLEPTDAGLADAAATKIAAANAAVAADTTVGQELWAYIPSMVMPNLYKLADKKYKDQHRYYVDSTPVVGDICTSNCTLSTAVWKTLLVGGLGRGGRGYYALDITDPNTPKALWEFTDANLGYSYGNPQIAKLSDGTWVVLVTSGYNNIPNDDGSGGDGVGRLYVLNAATGVPIPSVSPISTGVGSVGSPSGLAKITAQVINPSSDNTVEAVYGGDLNGNLWRFDVNDSLGSLTSGYDAQLLAILKDGSGNTQPITTKPEIGLIQNEKVVFVGTGRYLAASDASDTSQQSMYAIKDVRSTTSIPATAIFDNPGGSPRVTGTSTEGFVRQIHSVITCPTNTLASICAQGSNITASTNNPVNFLSDNGWFVDLIGSSERANTDPALALGLLAFTTNLPSLVACDVGGKSYIYFLDYLTGGPIYSPGNGTSSLNNGAVGKFLGNELASSPAFGISADGKLHIYTGGSGGGIYDITPPIPAPASVTRRTSWRELIRGN